MTAPGDNRLPHLVGARALRLLEENTPRHDEVPAAFLVFDDPELVDTPFVHRRIRSQRVDLRERAERALAGDAHFVSAFDGLFNLALYGKARLERVFELPLRGGSPRQFPGEFQSAGGRDHHRLHALAHGDFDVAVGVLQFVELNRGFALPAHVDERHLRTDGDDGALDGLTFLDAFGLNRRLEHGGEVFGRLAHSTCLMNTIIVGLLPMRKFKATGKNRTIGSARSRTVRGVPQPSRQPLFRNAENAYAVAFPPRWYCARIQIEGAIMIYRARPGSVGLAILISVATLGSTTSVRMTAASNEQPAAGTQKPNILVIVGDDIGQSNISAYSRGVMGFTQHRPRCVPHASGRGEGLDLSAPYGVPPAAASASFSIDQVIEKLETTTRGK